MTNETNDQEILRMKRAESWLKNSDPAERAKRYGCEAQKKKIETNLYAIGSIASFFGIPAFAGFTGGPVCAVGSLIIAIPSAKALFRSATYSDTYMANTLKEQEKAGKLADSYDFSNIPVRKDKDYVVAREEYCSLVRSSGEIVKFLKDKCEHTRVAAEAGMYSIQLGGMVQYDENIEDIICARDALQLANKRKPVLENKLGIPMSAPEVYLDANLEMLLTKSVHELRSRKQADANYRAITAMEAPR